jgi:hypothetical protein
LRISRPKINRNLRILDLFTAIKLITIPSILEFLEFIHNLDGCIVGAPAGAAIAGGVVGAVFGPVPAAPAAAAGSVIGCVGLGLAQATGLIYHQPVLG